MVPSSGGNVSFHELADPVATQRAAAELQDDPARAALAETLVATAQRDGGLSLHAHHTLHPAATWGQTEQSVQQGPQQTEPRPPQDSTLTRLHSWTHPLGLGRPGSSCLGPRCCGGQHQGGPGLQGQDRIAWCETGLVFRSLRQRAPTLAIFASILPEESPAHSLVGEPEEQAAAAATCVC